MERAQPAEEYTAVGAQNDGFAHLRGYDLDLERIGWREVRTDEGIVAGCAPNCKPECAPGCRPDCGPHHQCAPDFKRK